MRLRGFPAGAEAGVRTARGEGLQFGRRKLVLFASHCRCIDLRGGRRPAGGLYDLGAYEYLGRVLNSTTPNDQPEVARVSAEERLAYVQQASAASAPIWSVMLPAA